MLNAISNISKIDSSIVLNQATQLNGYLPVSVKIKQILKDKEYLLELSNNKIIKSKAEVDLSVGDYYWGVLDRNNRDKSVSILNLLKQPTQLQIDKRDNILKMSIEELETIFNQDNSKEKLKILLLTKLSNASSKEEFLVLTNLLNALNKDIFTMFLKDGDKNRFVQFKKSKVNKKDKDEQNYKIDFYTAFENLGPLEGVIEIADGVKKLSLYLFYENSFRFLQKELDSLDFESFLYKKEGNISPLYEYGSSLLDVKG